MSHVSYFYRCLWLCADFLLSFCGGVLFLSVSVVCPGSKGFAQRSKHPGRPLRKPNKTCHVLYIYMFIYLDPCPPTVRCPISPSVCEGGLIGQSIFLFIMPRGMVQGPPLCLRRGPIGSFFRCLFGSIFDRFSTPTWLPKSTEIDQKPMPRCLPLLTSFFHRFLVHVCSQLRPS